MLGIKNNINVPAIVRQIKPITKLRLKPKLSIMYPPRSGPIANPMKFDEVNIPIPLVKCFFGNKSETNDRVTIPGPGKIPKPTQVNQRNLILVVKPACNIRNPNPKVPIVTGSFLP